MENSDSLWRTPEKGKSHKEEKYSMVSEPDQKIQKGDSASEKTSDLQCLLR